MLLSRAPASSVATHLQLQVEDRGFNPLPLFHINAEVVGLLSADFNSVLENVGKLENWSPKNAAH